MDNFCVSNLGWCNTLLGLSFLAAILGLGLLLIQPDPQTSGSRQSEQSGQEDRQLTREHLLRMTFVYWLVYVLAVFAQKAMTPELATWLAPLKITAFFTYFLTFASVLCLPLNYIEAQIAARRWSAKR
jgi:hypothetical protein